MNELDLAQSTERDFLAIGIDSGKHRDHPIEGTSLCAMSVGCAVPTGGGDADCTGERAGEGTRTLDIQLGKLGASQISPDALTGTGSITNHNGGVATSDNATVGPLDSCKEPPPFYPPLPGCSVTHECIKVYHARPEVSTSQIKDFCEDVLAFHPRHFTKTAPARESKGMTNGTWIHSWSELGSAEFSRRQAIAPAEFVTAGGALKASAQSWLTSLPPDAIPMAPADAALIESQIEGIYRNPMARELMAAAVDREFSVSWTWEGFPVRCRCDFATELVWCDLKTTREVRPRNDFWKSVQQYRYGMQAAMYGEGSYQAGWPQHEMVFIVVSSVWPFACHCVTLPPALVTQGRYEVLAALATLRQRVEFDHWLPDDYGTVSELPMPAFMREPKYGG